jgi:hypothetical protein
MAMFARRSLQHLLDRLSGKISPEVLKKFAHEMDRKNPSALGYEWELVLLYALAEAGDVAYEAELSSGKTRPDFTFVSQKTGIRFVADVTMVSDAGLEEDNPVTRFSQRLYRLKEKHGLKGSLNHHVAGATEGPTYRNRKTRLKLPKVGDLDSFLTRHVGPHFERIARGKLTKVTFAINEPGVEFTVTYDEAQRFGGSSYPSYTAAQSLTRNPVYLALKAKAAQLKKSGTTDPLGIFLCDGGCELLSRPGRQQTQIGLDEVVANFFRQNSSIAFVIVLVFPPTRVQAFTGIVKELRITGRVYSNPRAANAVPEAILLEQLNSGLTKLPSPVATPRDALYWINRLEPHHGKTVDICVTRGGLMAQSVKMSARKMQELLSGKITADQLFADYTRPGETIDNPFARALRMGLTIETVKFKKVPHQDDDEVEIVFGLPDPAVSKFRIDRPDDNG